jgi:hypothetical protein
MSRSLLCLWILVIAASAGVLIVGGSRAARAHAESAESRRELISVTHQASELARLRRGGRDFPNRPEGGLAAKVASAMSRAGLASSILQSLSPEAQSAISGEAGARIFRQRATLTLAGLSLPQVGKLLDAWRTAEPDWLVSSIDLTPITSKDSPSIGTDLPLRAVIAIEGVFKEPPRKEPSKPGASR